MSVIKKNVVMHPEQLLQISDQMLSKFCEFIKLCEDLGVHPNHVSSEVMRWMSAYVQAHHMSPGNKDLPPAHEFFSQMVWQAWHEDAQTINEDAYKSYMLIRESGLSIQDHPPLVVIPKMDD